MRPTTTELRAAALAALVIGAGGCAGKVSTGAEPPAIPEPRGSLYFADFEIPAPTDGGLRAQLDGRHRLGSVSDGAVAGAPMPGVAHRTDHQLPGCNTFRFVGLTAGQRQDCLDALVQRGYGHVYLHVSNAKGFEHLAKPETFGDRLAEIRDRGLEPVVWVVPDDQPELHDLPAWTLKWQLAELLAKVDDKVSSYVLGRQLDEFWSESKIDDLGDYLAGKTNRPVGISLAQAKSWPLAKAMPWVDFLVLSYTGELDDEEIADTTQQAIKAVGKPVIAGFYGLGKNEGSRAALGDAALAAGAAGFGHGGPP